MPIALSKLKASTVSIYMNLQPLTASIVAIVIGQDTFSWDKPLTAVLVIAGVYLVTGNEK
jgi:drug/metabolite transporter (DMT)-like permease